MRTSVAAGSKSVSIHGPSGAKVSQLFNGTTTQPPGVHPSAVISGKAFLGKDVSVGAGCVVGEGVRIGDGSCLYPRVVVYPGCSIGARAIVHSGAVIGADGFGIAEEKGRWVKIPQIGAVRIGDDVEIGANTTIDRGALDDTVIEDGVKLDNLVHVAHNVRIGAYSALAGQAVAEADSARLTLHLEDERGDALAVRVAGGADHALFSWFPEEDAQRETHRVPRGLQGRSPPLCHDPAPCSSLDTSDRDSCKDRAHRPPTSVTSRR